MDAILKNRYNDICFIGVVFSDEIRLADAKSHRKQQILMLKNLAVYNAFKDDIRKLANRYRYSRVQRPTRHI